MWLEWASRKTPCEKCFAIIEKDQPLGVLRLTEGKNSKRITLHPECMMHTALDALMAIPVSRPVRGRKGNTLNDAEKLVRKRIQQRYAAYQQRIGILEVDREYERNPIKVELMGLKISRLEILKDKLRQDIAAVGGVPTQWLNSSRNSVIRSMGG